MSARNKERGYEQEVEIVDFWESRGYEAERAYASVGESLTDSTGEQLTEDVDNIVYRALPGGKDLLIQAKRRKSLGSYLLPTGMQDGVYLAGSDEDPPIYVFPDYFFAELVEGSPQLFLHLNVDESRTSIASYVYPPEGAHVSAIRPDGTTTSYYTVPERLMHQLKTAASADVEPAGSNDQTSNVPNVSLAHALREVANNLENSTDE